MTRDMRKLSISRLCAVAAMAVMSAFLASCTTIGDGKVGTLASYEHVPSAYLLDTGDQLRLFVFDQEAMSRNYAVDDRGSISIPLVGNVVARGRTTVQLERAVIAELRRANIVSAAKVSVEIIAYRPFFIYGEVKGAGRYVYQPFMNVEMALATAGGITERGSLRQLRVTRVIDGNRVSAEVTLDFKVQPGDTIYVNERWF